MIGPDGLLLVVSHLIAVLALVLLVGLEKCKEPNFDVVAHMQSTVGAHYRTGKEDPMSYHVSKVMSFWASHCDDNLLAGVCHASNKRIFKYHVISCKHVFTHVQV